MNNLPESLEKRRYAVKTWEELRRFPGPAPSLETVKKVLEGDDTKMLTLEEVEDIVYGYFEKKIETVEGEAGEVMTYWKSPPTKTELCAILGISFSTLQRYLRGTYADQREYQGMTSERLPPESFPLLRKAVMLIQDFYESLLAQNRNHSGEIFWLLNSQNDRWSNDQTLELKAVDVSSPRRTSEEIAAQYESYAALPELSESNAE